MRRVRLAGRLYRTGETIYIRGSGALRCAWGLVSTQQARPADERTASAVELYAAARQLGEVDTCPTST